MGQPPSGRRNRHFRTRRPAQPRKGRRLEVTRAGESIEQSPARPDNRPPPRRTGAALQTRNRRPVRRGALCLCPPGLPRPLCLRGRIHKVFGRGERRLGHAGPAARPVAVQRPRRHARPLLRRARAKSDGDWIARPCRNVLDSDNGRMTSSPRLGGSSASLGRPDVLVFQIAPLEDDVELPGTWSRGSISARQRPMPISRSS